MVTTAAPASSTRLHIFAAAAAAMPTVTVTNRTGCSTGGARGDLLRARGAPPRRALAGRRPTAGCLEVERAEAWEREHDGRGGTVVAQRQDLQVLELGEHAVGIARRSASSLASNWRMWLESLLLAEASSVANQRFC